LDTIRKRCDFMNAAMQRAGMTNAHTLWTRAEEAARKPERRDQYDLAVARAVRVSCWCLGGLGHATWHGQALQASLFCIAFVRPDNCLTSITPVCCCSSLTSITPVCCPSLTNITPVECPSLTSITPVCCPSLTNITPVYGPSLTLVCCRILLSFTPVMLPERFCMALFTF
jgi:rRNA small subunit methyltransferase G